MIRMKVADSLSLLQLIYLYLFPGLSLSTVLVTLRASNDGAVQMGLGDMDSHNADGKLIRGTLNLQSLSQSSHGCHENLIQVNPGKVEILRHGTDKTKTVKYISSVILLVYKDMKGKSD